MNSSITWRSISANQHLKHKIGTYKQSTEKDTRQNYKEYN